MGKTYRSNPQSTHRHPRMVLAEQGFTPRAARNARLMPSAWDDKPHAAAKEIVVRGWAV